MGRWSLLVSTKKMGLLSLSFNGFQVEPFWGSHREIISRKDERFSCKELKKGKGVGIWHILGLSIVSGMFEVALLSRLLFLGDCGDKGYQLKGEVRNRVECEKRVWKWKEEFEEEMPSSQRKGCG